MGNALEEAEKGVSNIGNTISKGVSDVGNVVTKGVDDTVGLLDGSTAKKKEQKIKKQMDERKKKFEAEQKKIKVEADRKEGIKKGFLAGRKGTELGGSQGDNVFRKKLLGE